MSYQKEWLKEFYPVKATSRIIKTEIQAIEHSLQKWKGAIKKNLKRHGLLFVPLDFDSSDCSLCEKYIRLTLYESKCSKCPIYIVTDNTCQKQYESWKQKKNPKPMINLLEKVLKAYKSKKK